jgi:hypothetical protein
MKRVIEIQANFSLISSSLDLVSKSNDEWRRIHHLSHSDTRSINDNILSKTVELNYTKFQNILQLILDVDRNSIFLKRDIKNAFRIILVASYCQWLLSFSWKENYYQETCLSFDLSTISFIFNLFAKDLDWILIFFLKWKHYLDDFIAVFLAKSNLINDIDAYN